MLSEMITALAEGFKLWNDKKHSDKNHIKDMDLAVDTVLAAAILTKGYLYNLRELHSNKDRDKEIQISGAWQNAANAVYRFDKNLYRSAQIKALGWADPR